MLKHLYKIACCTILVLFAACSDDPEGTPTDRYVYYALTGQGLHRYSIVTGIDEAISQDKVMWITEVAENGIVLFSTQSSGVRSLWGRCENGGIIPVPMPVAESPAEEYVLSATPPTLSWKGHHAAFVVYKRPLNSVDTTQWSASVCVYDCAAQKMKVGDVSAFLRSSLVGTGLSPDVVRVHAAQISDYGDVTALVAHIDDIQSDGSLVHRSAILAFDATGLRILDPIDIENGGILSHFKFDPKTSVFYAFPPWKQPFAVDSRTGDVRDLVTPVVPFAPWTPVAWQTSEFVDFAFPRLGLRRIDSGTETPVIEDTGIELHSHMDLMHGAGHTPALSPDGAWIGLQWATKDDQDVVFLFSRDGSDIRRMVKGAMACPVSISAEVPK